MSDDRPIKAQPGRCRQERCQASVYWLRNVNTYVVAPIDLEPVDNGNLRLDLESAMYAVVSGASLLGARSNDEPLHVNHWMTCVDPPPSRRRQPRSPATGPETEPKPGEAPAG